MIVVRNSFIAKPGQASKLAAQLKEMATAGNLVNHRVLTDRNRRIQPRCYGSTEAESLAAFEATFKKYSSDPQIREKAKGYTDLWLTGAQGVVSGRLTEHFVFHLLPSVVCFR